MMGRPSNGDREQQESLLGAGSSGSGGSARGMSSDLHMAEESGGGLSDLQRLQVSGGVNPNKQSPLFGSNNPTVRGNGQSGGGGGGYGAIAMTTTTTPPSSSLGVVKGGASVDRELIAARRLAALGLTSTTTTSTTTNNTTTNK